MESSRPQEIVREIRIEASPEIVFSYLIDPARLVSWMGTVASLDPRPGGMFRLDYNGQHVTSGTYLEVDPPRRVVFSWGWEGGDNPTPPGSSRVEFNLRPDGDATILTLTHRALSPKRSRRMPRAGTISCPASSSSRRAAIPMNP